MRTVTVRMVRTSSAPKVVVAASLLAAGSAVEATIAVTVLERWASKTVYNTGQRVLHDGSVWLASWCTRNQAPGDPYGPWQQIVVKDGVAVWTASRIFTEGEVATHNGAVYVAKWWTRNQAPGDPNGPWKLKG